MNSASQSPRGPGNASSWGLASLLTALAVTSGGVRAQEPAQDVVFFTGVDLQHFAESDLESYQGDGWTPSVDVVYTRQNGRFRLFSEILLTDEEQEVERLSVGWSLSDEVQLALGRFHYSSSYWNTHFHHGQYLQTSISRPAIERFEDRGGVLPLHDFGLLLEQRTELDWGSAIDVSLSAGLSGKFENGELRAFDVLNPESGFGTAVNARVAYLPDALGESQVGITFGMNHVEVDDPGSQSLLWDPFADEIELQTLSVYGHWYWPRWQVIGSVMRVFARSNGEFDSSVHAFTSSYGQAERSIGDHYTVYGRVEHTSGDFTYLNIFPEYVSQQSVAGMRWDFLEKHALKFELTNSSALGDHFHRYRIQWSAALP